MHSLITIHNLNTSELCPINFACTVFLVQRKYIQNIVKIHTNTIIWETHMLVSVYNMYGNTNRNACKQI